MKYPTPREYQQAVQLPAEAFLDPQLQQAQPEMSVLGLPRAITGAFAVVFPVRAREAQWAVKCFVTHVKDQEERYEAIAAHHMEAALPYTVPFEYQPKGIRVDGRTYPILKMEWIEAETLNRFVARNLQHTDVLGEMVEHWREMMRALEAAEIAHGDLQHGNVLVDKEGALRLVDYDTMYVPGLLGKASLEVGHRNFQHADRDETDFGPYLDRFPSLVIDTGLRACAARPQLWDTFDTGENILFRSDDLAAPAESALFAELEAVDELRGQVEALRRACFLEPEDIPPLSIVTSNTAAVPEARPDSESTRTAFDRYVYPIAAVILLVVALRQAAGSVEIVLLVASVGGLIAATLAWLKYRQLPVVRRRRRLRKEQAYFRRLLEGLRGEERSLKMRRDELSSSHEKRHEQRLAELQAETLQDRLKHHFIGEAREFDDINHKVIVRLKASGIRTAAHATPERVEKVIQMSAETKARVNLWRASVVARYRDEIPEQLSPAAERRLQRALDRELEVVGSELTRVRSRIAVQEEESRKIQARANELQVPSFPHYLTSLARPASSD